MPTDALKRIEVKHWRGHIYPNYCILCNQSCPCDVVKLARALENTRGIVAFALGRFHSGGEKRWVKRCDEQLEESRARWRRWPVPEKPLHVQIAEALGWSHVRCRAALMRVAFPREEWWYGNPPNKASEGVVSAIPRYDTDWSATGPLIEKYRFDLSFQDPHWRASQMYSPFEAYGEPTLIAVCNLILALAKEGKL